MLLPPKRMRDRPRSTVSFYSHIVFDPFGHARAQWITSLSLSLSLFITVFLIMSMQALARPNVFGWGTAK